MSTGSPKVDATVARAAAGAPEATATQLGMIAPLMRRPVRRAQQTPVVETVTPDRRAA